MKSMPPKENLVDDIRPDNVAHSLDFAKAQQCDLNWVLARKKFFVKVPCPACGDENIVEAVTKQEFEFVRCSTCQTLYMHERLPKALLGEFYSQSQVMEYFGKVIFPASYENRVKNIYRPRLSRLLDSIKHLHGSMEHFIEIGAGSGVFLELLARENVFNQVTAIEPNELLAKECARRGLRTLAKPVEMVTGLKADVVASFEVIEHLFSPRAYLEAMGNVLKNGGLCFLTTPNSLSLEVLELGALSTTVSMNHINLFTPTGIEKIAAKTGFEVVEILTPGLLDVDLVRQGYKLMDNNRCSPFLKYLVEMASVETVKNFQHFISNNKLSSHMWAVLKSR